MSKLILLGGGGHCKACIDVIERTGEFTIHGILDRPEHRDSTVLGYPVVGTDEEIESFVREGFSFLITVGQVHSPLIRIRLYETLKRLGAPIATVVSPRAYVSPHAQLGEGTIVMHDALINAGAIVGSNCIINTKALIEHDCRIEDHCHLSTGSILNGNALIRKGTFFGSNATGKEGSVSKAEAFIKAGSIFKGANHG